MERYLLFDSGCNKCSSIAHAAEDLAGGWLTVRSLTDANVRKLLDQSYPSWRWEPMLVEVGDSGKVKVFRGLSLRLYLLLRLGVRRALRLANLIVTSYRNQVGAEATDPSRRKFLRQSGTSLAAIAFLLGLPNGVRENITRRAAQPNSEMASPVLQGPPGELYEGFVLLPEIENPIPDFVQLAPGIVLHDGDPTSPATGENVVFSTIEELVSYAAFPIYAPTELPHNVQFIDVEVIRHAQTDDIYQAFIRYGQYNADTGTLDPSIIIWAQPEYNRPFPVWPYWDPASNYQHINQPEKAHDTPTPGLALRGSRGHVFQWIARDVLYTLAVEHNSDRGAANQILRSLVQLAG